VLGVEDATKSLTDARLVKCSLEGDRHSFRLLYRRHQQRVRQILYQICDPATLDDLVQEVFLRAWKGLPKFRHDAQFSTWLYRIAWNVGSDRRKILAQDRARIEIVARNVVSQHDDPDVLVGIASPLENLHYQDLVLRGLSALSEEHRSVLVLHDLEEIPQKEVAEILEIPIGTIKSRLFHARNNMRAFLEGEGVQL
jgi:RNA polymerase sigma factor (sigma-70 family)